MALIAIAAVDCAEADEASPPPPDKSQFSLLDPTPDANLRAFQPERPAKISNPYTVDAGHFQIESDFANYSQSDFMGTRTQTFEALDPAFKLGVLNNVDVEMLFNGYQHVRQSTIGVPGSMHLSGFGDVYFRAKVNLLGNDGGDYAFALIPYVKAPSGTPVALALGNDVVEGGGIAVAQINLPKDFTLALQTEVDALKGGNDTARHPNFVNIVNLSHPVPGIKDLTIDAEIYTSVSEDRLTPDIYTADFALAYLIAPTTQLDVGTNIGLDDAAPKFQVYAGISQRF